MQLVHRFEFIFTNLISGTPRLIASVLNVYKTYNATRLYRELKLRSAIIHNRALKVIQYWSFSLKILWRKKN